MIALTHPRDMEEAAVKVADILSIPLWEARLVVSSAIREIAA